MVLEHGAEFGTETGRNEPKIHSFSLVVTYACCDVLGVIMGASSNSMMVMLNSRIQLIGGRNTIDTRTRDKSMKVSLKTWSNGGSHALANSKLYQQESEEEWQRSVFTRGIGNVHHAERQEFEKLETEGGINAIAYYENKCTGLPLAGWCNECWCSTVTESATTSKKIYQVEPKIFRKGGMVEVINTITTNGERRTDGN
ncbi:hypothetical protein BDQ12DRAFT_670667 [Crucibulum laeve]|uniref:Uncharacterized protein n=1 Tax=Crucibulum laeve TaxID=68775 RepID=A0A5C3LK72_9AGAR|nr:hypothetical protein BDQ12DRAFT_670667 [Crucibulum laeve]